MGDMRRTTARVRCCFVVVFLIGPIGLIRPIAPAPAAAAEVNPTARLKVVKTTTLWKSPDGKVSAQRARFTHDGKLLAWFTTDGKLMYTFLTDPTRVISYSVPDGGTVTHVALSPAGILPACVRIVKAGQVVRAVAMLRRSSTELYIVKGTDGAYNAASRAGSTSLAFSTKTALFHYDRETGKTVKLLDQQKGWRPKKAPAYEDLVLAGKKVAARAAGTMRWWLAEPGKKALELGELRGLCPDPKRNRLYAVPWLAGPARIPRGAGLVCIDPREKQPKRRVVVPFDHTTGRPYWLVDIFDAMYPTTLRVSPDGKTLTFCGVKAGVLSKNAWREFCIWRVPADGSAPPKAVAKCGPIFKRIDVGDTHFIGWRYKIDNAVVLGDLKSGKAWRLPKNFYVQRVNTDVLVDKLLVGAARGKEVVLIQLAEDKR